MRLYSCLFRCAFERPNRGWRRGSASTASICALASGGAHLGDVYPLIYSQSILARIISDKAANISEKVACQVIARPAGLNITRQSKMPDGLWSKADYYRQLVDECIALAQTATSNEIRAEHYATAEYYLHLAKLETNLADRSSKHDAAFRLDVG